MKLHKFKRLQAGRDKVSAKEYNALVETVEQITRSLMSQGIVDSTGFHTRRSPGGSKGGTDITIFEVQSAGSGDGLYNCYEQTLDATEWSDTAGDPKFDDKDTTSVEVLNLAEFDPEATYVAQLTANDLIAAWEMTDDEGTSRYIGVPFRKDSSGIRKAYCKTDAGAGSTIVCYLDEDSTGDEITVNCTIVGGSGTTPVLQDCLPFLNDGQEVIVSKINEDWILLYPAVIWVGEEEERSLAHNAEDDRPMAVYK